MEREKIGIWGRVKMMKLGNTGFIEISQDRKKEDYLLVMSKGIRRKYLVLNFPEEMLKVRCAKEEILLVINDFLNENFLAS